MIKKLMDSFLELFSPFYFGPQTLEFISEKSRDFLKNLEELPQNIQEIEILKYENEIFMNNFPYFLEESKVLDYINTLSLFEKLKISGFLIKRNIKIENFVQWIQDFQKGQINENQWIKIYLEEKTGKNIFYKLKFLKALKDSLVLIEEWKKIEEKIKKGEIVSYAPLRIKIKNFLKDLLELKESSLFLFHFFYLKNEKLIPFIILIFNLIEPLELQIEEMEDVIFSSFFYDIEEGKKWVPLMQAKNFSSAGFLSFLSSRNHPNLLFTLFYGAFKIIEILFSKPGYVHPREALNKFYEMEEIPEEIKNYVLSLLDFIPPSSFALTEECEPCLVISKKEIAVFSENKFILKEKKAEKAVPPESFPFNPIYIILNLNI